MFRRSQVQSSWRLDNSAWTCFDDCGWRLAKFDVCAFLWARLIPSSWEFKVPPTFLFGLGTRWYANFADFVAHIYLREKWCLMTFVVVLNLFKFALAFCFLQQFQVWQFGNQLVWWHWEVERVFLSMSSYAVGVSVLQWCRFGTRSRVSSLFIVALQLKQLNYTIITKNKINNNIK